MQTKVKTASEISAMRESGKILVSVLELLTSKAKVGITTKALAELAASELKALGGEGPFLGYQGAPGYQNFPDVICISLNDEVVHGIPSDRVLADGDIVSLDFGVKYKGMITDAARTIIVGRAKQKGHVDLVKNTLLSLEAGIATLHDQVRTGDIGHAIETELNRHRYGIVRDLVGHGVGHHLHEDPNIPNYGRPNTGPWLSAGMTIAIEPMVTLGTDNVHVAKDGWTILTNDSSWAAHFEDTVLITEDGAEVLTRP